MWYDLLVLAILGFFTLRGAARGLFSQLAAIAAIFVCLAFAESISAAFGPYVHLDPPLNHWVVMFVAYLVCTFIAFGIARVMDDWMARAKLESFNQHLGAMFGLAKGITLCLVLTFFLVTLSPASRDALSNSRSAYFAARILDRIHPVMPEKLNEALAKYLHIYETGATEGADPTGQVTNDPNSVPYPPSGSIPTLPGTNPGSWFPNAPNQNQPNQSTYPPQSIPVAGTREALDFFMRQLPTTIDPDLRNLIGQSLAQTPPEQWAPAQQQLWNMLRQTRPEDLRDLQTQLRSNPRQTLSNAISGWMGSFVSPGGSSTNSTPVGTVPPFTFPSQTPAQPQYTQPAQPQYNQLSYPTYQAPTSAPTQQYPQPQPQPSFTQPAPAPQQPWQQPQPQPSTTPVQSPPPLVAGPKSVEDQLLQEISRAFSSIPPVQLQVQSDIRQRLSGLPDGVGQSVLEDWRRDLWYTNAADPDPSTNSNTSLEARIMRQLQARGIPTNRLSGELQRRLQDAVTR